MKTKNYVDILLENGIHFNTISKMGKRQVRLLAEKFNKKEVDEVVTKITTTVTQYQADQNKDVEIPVEPGTKTVAVSGTQTPGKTTLTPMKEGEVTEKFESKAQQKLFFMKCGDGKTKEQKKWCKLRDEFASSTTKKDYEDMPEYASDDDEKESKPKRRKSRRKPTSKRKSRRRKSTNESYLESRILQMVEKHIEPSMTKGELLQLLEDKKKAKKEVITIRQHQMDDLHTRGYFISKGMCFIYLEDIKKDKDKLEKIERLKEKKGDDACVEITKKQMMMLHSDNECDCSKDITLKYTKPKKETKESFILKKPIKNSLFSHNEGLEMKRPIGRLSSLGEDTKTAPTKDPKTKPGTKKPGRRNPFKRPGPKEKPRADKEKQKSDFMLLIKQVLNIS